MICLLNTSAILIYHISVVVLAQDVLTLRGTINLFGLTEIVLAKNNLT